MKLLINKINISLWLIVLLLTTLLVINIYIEIKKERELTETQKRAIKLKFRPCYTWQDIEHIVFGNIQE